MIPAIAKQPCSVSLLQVPLEARFVIKKKQLEKPWRWRTQELMWVKGYSEVQGNKPGSIGSGLDRLMEKTRRHLVIESNTSCCKFLAPKAPAILLQAHPAGLPVQS